MLKRISFQILFAKGSSSSARVIDHRNRALAIYLTIYIDVSRIDYANRKYECKKVENSNLTFFIAFLSLKQA